jgi:hypothetical protein
MQSDFKYGHQVAILENQQSAITPELWLDHLQIFIMGTSTCNKDTWHDTQVFDLTYMYFLKVTGVKVQNSTNIGMFHYSCYYLTWHAWNILTLCEHVSRHHLPFNQISAWSDFKYGCHLAILEKNKVLLLLN